MQLEEFKNKALCPGGLCTAPAPQDISRAGLAFVAACIVDGIFMVAVSIAIWVDNDKSTDTANTARTYAVLSVVCVLFFVYFAITSVMFENRFQLFGSLVTSLILWLVLLFKCFEHDYTLGELWVKYKFVVVGVQAAFVLVYAALTKPAVDAFGYFEYKIAGADTNILRMFRNYRVFLTLLKVDLLFLVLIMVVSNVFLNTFNYAVIVTIAVFVVSVAWALLGWFSITHERKTLFIVWLLSALVLPGYMAFKLVVYIDEQDQLPTDHITLTQLIFVLALAGFVRLLLLAFSIAARHGFGRGLQQVFYRGQRGKRGVATVPVGAGASLLSQGGGRADGAYHDTALRSTTSYDRSRSGDDEFLTA